MVTDPIYQIISFAVCGLIEATSAIADDSVVSYQALHFLLVMEFSLGINEIWPYI